MNNKFDVFVIGTGVAGSKIASACSKAGKKVGICDYREFGGTCGLRGCNPKKVLTGFAEAQTRFNFYKEKGIISGENKANWNKLISFKDEFIKDIPKNRAKSFAKKKIKTFKGKAKFIGKNKLKINDNKINAEIIVIATGAIPRKMNIPGEEFLTTSEDFLALNDLPSSIIFIGGGYISFELAHIASQFETNIKIIERSSKPLSAFDPNLVDFLIDSFEEKNINIKTKTSVKSIKKVEDQFLVETSSGKRYKAAMVVHGAGRVPQINDLDLEKGAIDTNKKGIIINPNLQSQSNNAVYIAGDAISNPKSLPLTPVASLEARTIIHNILNNDSKSPNYEGTASSLYTFPPLARTGMLEQDAKKAKIDYGISYADTSEHFSTKRLGFKKSAYKILYRKDDYKIIGAHLLGHHVDEVINIFALAIRNGFTITKLKDNLWTFPSVTDVMDEMLNI